MLTLHLAGQSKIGQRKLEIDVENWGELCWFGSLNNQAQDVMFACEKAVKLTPNYGEIRRYRGLARALTGNYQGAIEDFQVLVYSMEDEEKKARVES